MTKSSSLLIRMLLYPLMYTLQFASEGVVVAIGMLLIYPFLSIMVDVSKKQADSSEFVYFISFLGIFLGSLYILAISFVDWTLYEKLKFIFPASMTVSTLLLSWIDSPYSELDDSSHFVEAFILACLIFFFTCFRDFYSHGTLDFRFGGFGNIYSFGQSTAFKSRIIQLAQLDLSISSLYHRALNFWTVGFIILCIHHLRKRNFNKD